MKLLNTFAIVFWRAVVKLVNDGGMAIASNVALSLLLSLFPFLMLIASLVRLYGDPTIADEVVKLILGHWPADSAQAIVGTVETLLQQPAGEFFSIGTMFALILATNGIENARDGLNRAYRVIETRSFFWRRIQSAVFVLVGALGLILVAFILVGTPLIWGFLTSRFEKLVEFAFVVSALQYGLSVALLGVILLAFHRFLPNVRYNRRTDLWGIALTILGIMGGSKLFGSSARIRKCG